MDPGLRRTVYVALLVALCAACRSSHYARYPSDWPELLVAASDEVQDISGRYADAGEAASTNPDGEMTWVFLRPVSLSQLLFPALRDAPDLAVSRVEISRDAAGALEFVLRGHDAEILRRTLPRVADAQAARSAQGYMSSPWYVIVSNQQVVHGEGTRTVRAVKADFAKTPDGSLVAHVAVDDRRLDFLIVPFPSREQWSFYYRFPPAP